MTVLGYKSKKLQQQGNFLSLKTKTKTKTKTEELIYIGRFT